MDGEYKYWAFVSYSWKDKDWGAWIFHQVDRYRPPRRLVNRTTPQGVIKREMLPAFRDREELAAGSDLTNSLQANLRAAQFLIVVCSPNSARSANVDKEIRYFKSLGREDRVFCLIAAGSPNATDSNGCYPPAVREKYNAQGQPTAEQAHPLAPDARPTGDGRRKARTKLLAGLLGVDHNELARREWWREFWQRVRLTSATALALAVIGFTWHYAQIQHLASLVETGRINVLAGSAGADKAFSALSQAYSAGEHSEAVRLMLRQARLNLPLPTSFIPHAALFCATFDPNGDRVLTAGENGTAVIYDLKTGKAGPTFRSHNQKCINWAVFNRDGSRVLTASNDGLAALWDSHDLRSPAIPIAEFQHDDHPYDADSDDLDVFPAVFSPDESLIASAGQDGIAKVWDAHATGVVTQCLVKFTKHLGSSTDSASGSIDALVFSRDGTKIVTAGKGDKTARVWNPRTGEEQCAIPMTGVGGLRYADFSPDGNCVVTCAWSGEADLWRIDQGPKAEHLRSLVTADEATGWTRRAYFSQDGSQLLTTSADGRVRVFDVQDGKKKPWELDHASHEAKKENKKVYDAAFSQDGQLIASGAEDNKVKLWRPAAQLQPIATLEAHMAKVVRVEFNHEMTLLSSAAYDGYAFIWDIRDPAKPKLLTRLPPEPPYLASLRMVSHASSVPLILTNEKGERIGAGGLAKIVRFSSDADDRDALLIDDQGIASVWETKSGRLLTTLPIDSTKNPGFSVADATFDQGAKRVMVAAKDGRMFVANVETRAHLFEVVTLRGAAVNSVHFLADPNCVMVAGNAAVEIWNLHRPMSPIVQTAGRFLAASDNGQLFVVADLKDSKLVRIYRQDGTKVGELQSLKGRLACLNFSADSEQLVGAVGTSLVVWNSTGALKYTIDHAHEGEGTASYVGFSPNGRDIISLGTDNEARLWNASDGKSLGALISMLLARR